MKRGKDEEKTIGPMFPRLHVNDTERGGPRAPPRNKMALYEQLSIPSQRFNGGSLPRNSNSSNNLNPPWSTQGSGHERGMHFPRQLPPSVNPTEEPTRYADFNPSMVQIEPKKRHGEDFTVPIFDQSNMGKSRNGTYNSTDREKSNKFDSNQSSRQKCESPVKQINASPSFGLRDQRPNYFHRENDTNDNLQQQFRDNSWVLRGDGAPFDCSRGMKDGNSFIVMGDQQQEGQRSYITPTNDAESQEDRGDDVSETSMVDSMSGTDLSPDDVVGIIGQKHFWKARRAIVNQQRVFAVQVFELHRLIKVQKLIAESPHILLEDNAFMGKPPKGSLAKEMPLDIIVKATPKVVKHKDVSQLPDNRVESSAENTVEKTSLSSSQNGSQPSSHGPFLRDPPPTTVNSDTKTGSWCYSQPTGHQWLIPVMTPSEGLVYKPYPGPGFMGPVYGPPGSTPVMGNYLNYGAPLPHHPCQGLGPAPLAGHGYFPPFSMPVMHPSFSGSAGPTNNPNMQYQASCNGPSQKNGAIWNAVNLNPSKDSELQVCTASSPSERAQRTSEGSNALPLFPMSPVGHGKNGGPGPDQPARVIKVVPHNAGSATESVARIFHSIQEERKLYDSV